MMSPLELDALWLAKTKKTNKFAEQCDLIHDASRPG